MPKRKKHIARAQQRAEAKMAGWKSKPKHEQRIDSSRSSQGISPPDASNPQNLGTRFAGLPTELRAEVFAWLLVRPVKWSATHMADCPLRSPELTATPFEDIRPRMIPSRVTCAAADPPMRRWRHRARPIFRDPWRSEWAPPITNEFLCSSCWDARFRSHQRPRIDSLPCLCARRRRADGLGALLVCKAWYEEGARVLYTCNTFAFASPRECVEFFNALDPCWSTLISKVSLLALTPVRECPGFAAGELGGVNSQELLDACIIFKTPPALSELELDILFLTRSDCVRIFRGPTFGNVRKVNFTQHMMMTPTEAPREFVWPRRALRELMESIKFTTGVVPGIKNWDVARPAWGISKQIKPIDTVLQ
ncbi:hypothetical protein F5Y10DRAFT_269221 [Nemania abortiva]|nr:hypothetical protein F5Y10DRAFT_269221 [Nemania abortiva]